MLWLLVYARPIYYIVPQAFSTAIAVHYLVMTCKAQMWWFLEFLHVCTIVHNLMKSNPGILTKLNMHTCFVNLVVIYDLAILKSFILFISFLCCLLWLTSLLLYTVYMEGWANDYMSGVYQCECTLLTPYGLIWFCFTVLHDMKAHNKTW